MAYSGGGISFRTIIKDKIKHSAIGETVAGKLNSLIKHDPQAEMSAHLRLTQSAGAEPSLHFSPTHTRSVSMDSMSSDKESFSSVKESLSAKSSVTSEREAGLAGKEPVSAKSSAVGDQRRLSFEVVESAEEVKEAQRSDVFEQQLAQLQEQLVSSMIENQNIAAELKEIRSDKQVQRLERDLAYERRKNNELLSKITTMAQQSTRKLAESNDTDSNHEEGADKPGEYVSSSPESPVKDGWVDKMCFSVLQAYYQLQEDFSVTSEDVVKPEVLEPLSVKVLRDNVKRFGTGVTPVFNIMSGFHLLFNWHTPLLTSTVFLVYMYACWIGFLVPGLLFILVLRLFLNLLEEWKFIPSITLLPSVKPAEPEKEKETSVTDKFNIVLDVAVKVQNKLGVMADGLEKLKNLFTWRRPGDTRQIFLPLCGALLMTLFLKLDSIMFILGSMLGLKLFVIDPIYNRFPRVKQRYDGSHRLWTSLVNDAELEKQTRLSANNQMVLPKHHQTSHSGSLSNSSRQSSAASLLNTSDILTEEDKAFCDRFNLPEDEKPVSYSSFKDGRHCIYIDKESSFKVTTPFQKHAKLYLTPSFLCYELVKQEERKAIPLASIVRIEKRKPLSFLPGNGMALEIIEEGLGKPHIFGGLLHRDDCYKTLMKVGAMNDLQYSQTHDELKKEIRLSDLVDEDDIGLDSSDAPQVSDLMT